MLNIPRQRVLGVLSLLLLSLLLAACGEAGATPTSPAQSSPSTSATLNNDTGATATPVVLSNSAPSVGSPGAVAFTAPASPTPASTAPASGTAPAPGALNSVGPLPTSGLNLVPVSPRPPTPSGIAAVQINKAPLSAFNLKSVAAVGLEQKTIHRIDNLLIPNGPLPSVNQPGVVEGSVLMGSAWRIAPPLLWCEDTKAHLDSVWSAFSFKMSLDDQPVDLKQFQTVDFDDSNFSCRTIDLAIGGAPPGLHRLEVTRTISKEVMSDTVGKKLPPGDYGYNVILITVAPNPNQKSTTPISNFDLGSSSGLKPLYQQVGQDFATFSDAQEQFKPGNFKYTAVLFAELQYGILGGWCAKDQKTLEENWKKMTYTLAVNGQPVDLSSVPQVDRQRGTQACRLWDLSMTPPEGQHQIIIKLNFASDTNDGMGTYLAGDYISEYTVLSLKLNG